jgi:hypothetical protein
VYIFCIVLDQQKTFSVPERTAIVNCERLRFQISAVRIQSSLRTVELPSHRYSFSKSKADPPARNENRHNEWLCTTSIAFEAHLHLNIQSTILYRIPTLPSNMTATTSKDRGDHKSKSRKRSATNKVDKSATEEKSAIAEAAPKEQFESSANPDESSSDDDEDADLMAAAAAWATKDSAIDETGIKTTKTKTKKTLPPPETKTWSLHVTQLAFETTDFDIRRHFVESGCAVTSLRMVYDRGLDGRRQFRGVCFIDVQDEESNKAALQLHKTILLKRRINVRPTRSKMELSNIVERTKELVTEKIRRNKEKQKLEEDSPGAMEADQDSKPKSKRKREGDTDNKKKKDKSKDVAKKDKPEPKNKPTEKAKAKDSSHDEKEKPEPKVKPTEKTKAKDSSPDKKDKLVPAAVKPTEKAKGKGKAKDSAPDKKDKAEPTVKPTEKTKSEDSAPDKKDKEPAPTSVKPTEETKAKTEDSTAAKELPAKKAAVYKLSKKERNKRAAIIMGKRRR